MARAEMIHWNNRVDSRRHTYWVPALNVVAPDKIEVLLDAGFGIERREPVRLAGVAPKAGKWSKRAEAFIKGWVGEVQEKSGDGWPFVVKIYKTSYSPDAGYAVRLFCRETHECLNDALIQARLAMPA